MADAAENAPMDSPDGMPRDSYRITWRDLCHILFSAIVIFIDFGFDICLAKAFYDKANESKTSEDREKNNTYFILTLVFLIVPSVIMTVHSFIGYYLDVRSHVYPKISVLRWIILSLFHLLQLAPIWRCGETLFLANRLTKDAKRDELSRRERVALEKHYHRAHYRLSKLKLLESFLEGCPQLVLQAYILIQIHDKKNEIIINCIKIGISLLSVAISMMNYQEKKRWDDPNRRVLHGPGVVLQFFWYLFTLLSRLVALAVLAELDVTTFCIAVPIHWLLMFLWIQYDKHKGNVDDNILHNLAIGGIYVFNFVKELNQPMKWHYVIYYSLVFGEGLTTMVVWYTLYGKGKGDNRDSKIGKVLMPIFFVSFALGITFMILHYRRHPSVVHRTNPLRIVHQSDPNSSADSEKTVIELSIVRPR